LLEKTRAKIGAKLRELRRSRRWSQAELAEQLQVSQSRLSQIERGTSSLTAEQFLLLLKIFNVSVSHFVSEPGVQALQIQNALARLGALHLHESSQILPSEQLDDVHTAVKEALVEGSPRLLTAIAPVLVCNADRLNLPKLFVELQQAGLGRRFAWVIENTRAALARFLRGHGSVSKQWAKIDRRAELALQSFLDIVAEAERDRDVVAPAATIRPHDFVDGTIRSKQTLDVVWATASEISRRWGVVTSLQVEDFFQALKAARADD
jgi:transcriptional regulator with XRE-family HTH domain